MIFKFMTDMNTYLTKFKEDALDMVAAVYDFIEDVVFVPYKYAKKANHYSQYYTFEKVKLVLKAVTSLKKEQWLILPIAALFFYYVPYAWIALVAFITPCLIGFALVIYAVFPRDRNKLIKVNYRAKLKNGRYVNFTVWQPRYTAVSLKEHFHFRAPFGSNGKIKSYYACMYKWEL